MTTNVIAGEFIEFGIFPADHPASVALGAQPLKDETLGHFSGGLALSPTDNLTLTV